MKKLKNVTGVPIAFNGVKGTVRFLKGEIKVLKDNELSDGLKEGVKNGSLLELQVEGQEPKLVTPKKSAKKNKEVE